MTSLDLDYLDGDLSDLSDLWILVTVVNCALVESVKKNYRYRLIFFLGYFRSNGVNVDHLEPDPPL